MRIIITLSLLSLSIITHAETTGQNQLGKTVYLNACSTCHAPKVAKGMKAPAAFDAHAWNERFIKADRAAKQQAERYPTAMDYLIAQTKIGKGLMHHGGLCAESGAHPNCSDKAYQQAILYMSQPQK